MRILDSLKKLEIDMRYIKQLMGIDNFLDRLIIYLMPKIEEMNL